MLPKPLAALGLIICLLIALHMMLGPAQRARVDDWLRGLRVRIHQLLDFSGRRRDARRARAETESLIRRVKASNPLPEGEWEGNVYRPKSFEPDKRKLH
ncbi:hypothetical protein [Pelomonas sp. SE-A7]|uniref:hypothetical protein n=1 Tax=Pelomonas sp. SE-A7 TaxID=3054953 RepID=UPI00259C931C|nr:hypothetical protein [Pelomonas sp. SE-A7]MDM4767867.1 hypothetical protein [Pelomonas sp. SE-A7]